MGQSQTRKGPGLMEDKPGHRVRATVKLEPGTLRLTPGNREANKSSESIVIWLEL